MNAKTAALATLLVASATFGTGCYADAQPTVLRPYPAYYQYQGQYPYQGQPMPAVEAVPTAAPVMAPAPVLAATPVDPGSAPVPVGTEPVAATPAPALSSVAAPMIAPQPGPEPVAAYGYQPQYYDGAVVYFDANGRPYYFNNGSAFWVPVQSPYYAGYTNHWRTYGGAYHRWYAGYGHRYIGWRRWRRW